MNSMSGAHRAQGQRQVDSPDPAQGVEASGPAGISPAASGRLQRFSEQLRAGAAHVAGVLERLFQPIGQKARLILAPIREAASCVPVSRKELVAANDIARITRLVDEYGSEATKSLVKKLNESPYASARALVSNGHAAKLALLSELLKYKEVATSVTNGKDETAKAAARERRDDLTISIDSDFLSDESDRTLETVFRHGERLSRKGNSALLLEDLNKEVLKRGEKGEDISAFKRERVWILPAYIDKKRSGDQQDETPKKKDIKVRETLVTIKNSFPFINKEQSEDEEDQLLIHSYAHIENLVADMLLKALPGS